MLEQEMLRVLCDANYLVWEVTEMSYTNTHTHTQTHVCAPTCMHLKQDDLNSNHTFNSFYSSAREQVSLSKVQFHHF